MRIFAGCFLAVFFIRAFTPAFAQTVSSAMQGRVFTDRTSVDGATVVLLKSRDSSVVKSTISNKVGLFYFDKLDAGSYLIFVTKFNYNRSYSGPYEMVSGKSRDIGFITINPSGNQLKEVVITGKKDFVEIKADKTVLNVDQNIMTTGASLFDVLSTSPGVKVLNDEVLFHGGQKALIAINGKPVLLTGEELTNLLKNYQSSSISKIELIDNPGGRYDAGSSGGGVINIILKKSKNLGSNISIIESGAYGDKYKFNTGINYSLRTTKLNLFASYSYVNSSIPHTINTSRNINNGASVDNFDLNYYADVKASNHNFNLGADYQLAPLQTVGFLISGFDNHANIEKRSTTYISTNGQRDSSIQALSVISRHIYNLNYNLNYKGSLDKLGKSLLSADADYTDYHRTSMEMLQNDFFNAAGQKDNNPIFYRDNSPSHITIKSANVNFSQAIAKDSRFSAGAKISQVNSDNQIDFDQIINGEYITIPDLTDHFIYKERIDAGYLQFDTKIDKTSLSISLRGERTSSLALSINPTRHVDTSYFNLFPNVLLTHQLDANNLISLSYARNIERPNYQDLNPFVSYVDEFYSSTGNPFLKPDYTNTFRISDLVLNKYKVSLSARVISNYFSSIFEQNDATKAYLVTKANIGTRNQLMAEFSLPFDITHWWHMDATIVAAHDRYVYKIDTIASKRTNWTTVNVNQTFKLTSKLDAQIIGNYESPIYWVINQYQPLYRLDAGISYSVLGNNGKIRLMVNDIFNSDYNRYHTNYANLDLSARDKVGTRFIAATFTFRFGSSSAKARSNTTEEQKRLSGSSSEN